MGLSGSGATAVGPRLVGRTTPRSRSSSRPAGAPPEPVGSPLTPAPVSLLSDLAWKKVPPGPVRSPLMLVLYQLAPNDSVASAAYHGRARTSAAMAAAAVVQPLPDQWVSVRQ